jgi:ABC-type Fe3+-hydroxamate transport system substrate-binding protein
MFRKPGKKNKKMKRIGIAAILAVFAASVTGCRPSPVLREIVYTENTSLVDTTVKQLKSEDDGQQTDDLVSKQLEDAKTKRDTEKKKAVQDDNSKHTGESAEVTDSDTAKDTAGSGSSSKDRKNSKGNGSTSDDTLSAADDAKDQNQNNNGDKADSNTENNGSDTDKNSDNSGGSDEKETAGAKKKKVTDASGKEVSVPENVGMVTAVGPAAAMVEMLGGEGRLMGTSESFKSSSTAQSLFSDLSDVKTWWEEDGNNAISSSDFAVLLKAKPDVCFEISGQDTFTNSQISQLEKAGISYVVLPALSSSQNLKDAVTIVGETLAKNKTIGKSAASIAKDYCDWVDDTVDTVSGKTSDKKLYSVYISRYAPDISYTLKHTNNDLPADSGVSGGKGKGVAITWSSKKAELISTYMKTAGVTNEGTNNTRLNATEGVYVAPMFHQFDPTFSNSDYTYYGGGETAISADLFVTHRVNSSSYYLLGSTQFPAIVVASDEVKTQIQDNWFWKHRTAKIEGKLDWKAGYLADSGNAYYSSVVGNYDIYVNPSGIGDWAEGSVESPLEAYWVAYHFQGSFSKDRVISETKSFYKKFFKHDLSTEQVKSILNF